jgi:protein-disulfide isomerase
MKRGTRPPRRKISTRALYLAAFGVAVALTAVFIAASLLTSRSGGAAPAASITGGRATTALLSGIPQHGTTLGSPTAPVKLVEYADLQCPYCGEWARNVFPVLVREYVRPGKLQIEFRGLDFVGTDSAVALRTALGASAQNRVWDIVDLLYRNQGTENTGWVTDSLLGATLAAVPGLDANRVLAARNGAQVAAQVQDAANKASIAGIRGTPSFELGRTGGQLQPLTITAIDANAFREPLNALLGR